MAATLILIWLEKIGEGFMSGIGGLLVAPIKQQFEYLCCFNSHITELETKLGDLEATRQVVQMGADEIRRQARDVRPDIKAWLKSVNEVTTEVKGIIQDMGKVEEGCLNGWCSNLKLRYSLSMQAVTKTKDLIDLRDVGVQYTQTLPSYSSPLPGLETITNRDFMQFETRRLNMEEIIKALKHDEINLIGVCGMGGVGKTTLVNEVTKRAKEDNDFDEVAMATVGQKPNPGVAQLSIADMLGLKNLRDTESTIERAELLRMRLLQDNKKVLVILDDIWEEFDLQTMGIPLEGADKNFKVLYTSRTRDLWHDLRTKKEIPLEVLSKDEAWQLFREKAGDSADGPDLQPIAKQIVDECGCLPLALVLIGKVLSKTSGSNDTKKIWKGILGRLTGVTNTPADKHLSSRLALSYEYLDEEARRLFLLCCLFQEDEDIRLEDLARYRFGPSLFDGMNQMAEVRDQVFLIVNDLRSRYLLLDSEKEECVKVHDLIRDMGISINATDKFALVRHGAISQWPKTATPERYTAISVISDQIEELPGELTYRNLEFLMLRCQKLEKLPPNFFKGMEKLKVLELRGFCGILTLQFLRNLTSLSLEGFGGTLYNVSIMGDLRNLETLSFRCSKIRELQEEIGELVNLKLLDLRYTTLLARIPPGIISRLTRLEEAYVSSSKFIDWEGEGEGKEEEVRNANLKEFGSLSNLNTLEIGIRSNVVIPKVPIFSKLKIYKVVISCYHYNDFDRGLYSENKCERVLWVEKKIPTPSDNGGIVSLLSCDGLYLSGKGCKDLVQELQLRYGFNGLQQMKVLEIEQCDTPECLVNTTNLVHLPTAPAPKIFPMLKQLDIWKLPKLREICCGPFPASSFGELTSIKINDCERLETLLHLPIEGCLTRREDVHVGTKNIIVFPKLESLRLTDLPSLVGFCKGIDQIDFPHLKDLCLSYMRGFNRLFHNGCNLSFNSEQNDNVGFLSLFPPKISLPNLEFLDVVGLRNLESLGHVPVGSFSKLKNISVRECRKLLCVFPSQLLPMLRELQELTVESCHSLEVVLELEGLESNEPNPEILSPLKLVKLHNLPKLSCISKRYPMGFKYIQTLEIRKCNSLRCVFAPTMTKSIPQLCVLKISSCEMLSTIVGESSVDEVEFPQLESLELLNLPNLVSFFPNVNVNTTTVAKSTDHLHNPMQPQPFFNEKVAILYLKYLVPVLHSVHDLQGSGFPTSSFSNLKNLQVAGCPSLRNFPSTSTQGLQEVAQLLYTETGKGVLALGSNGTMMLWKWGRSQHNLVGMATTSVLPQQWEPPNGLAMTNDVTSVNLEEAVPCMALSKNYYYMISACGGKFSLFNMMKFGDMQESFKAPPPASTFLAFHPRDNNIIAIGMEDSTICMYHFRVDEVKSELKGRHSRRITGLAFSTNLNILVSSGADAQLCIWNIDTWEHLKSVPLQLPANKAWNSDTRVQFHSDQIHLLVSHETQLAIYNALEMDRIFQWVPQDVLFAPISFAAYSCDSQLVYTSFCDGNIGVFDASLTLTRRIAPSIYLSPAMLSGGQIVYPKVVTAHPQKPNQFALGLTNGFVVLMEPQESEGKWRLSPTQATTHLIRIGERRRTKWKWTLTRRIKRKRGERRRKEKHLNLDEDEEDQEEKWGNRWYEDEDEEEDKDVDEEEDEEDQEENGVGPIDRSMEKQKTLDDVTDKSKPWKVAENQCQLVGMPNSIDEAHKVARLLYTNSGNDVIALGSNGTMTLWKWDSSQHNPSGEATTSVFPQQWRPASGLAMTNDVTGVNLEEAVPCMALSKYNYMISACGGKVSLFNMKTFRVLKTFTPPPPASTFLAFYPREFFNIVAVGMEDSTIRIYNFMAHKVISELKGHKKHITGLAFSTKLNKLVSSGADAQLCIWSTDTWEHLKSVPIQLPTCKACNGDTRVEFHSDQIRLLVSHETQLAIYDASEMDCIRQWVPQDVLPALISFAAYSCDSQFIYTSFCDGDIGVFDAHSLTLTYRISPSIYLSPPLLRGGQAVYPRVVAAHPSEPNQFAIGMTNGSVIVMEPPESEGKWGLSPTVDNGMLNDRTTSSSNTSNHTPDQFQSVEEGDSATSSAHILPQASGSNPRPKLKRYRGRHRHATRCHLPQALLEEAVRNFLLPLDESGGSVP